MVIISLYETLLTKATNKSKTSQYSYIYDVNIQKTFCDQTLVGHSFRASDADCIGSSDKITVYYQIDNSFHLTIPKVWSYFVYIWSNGFKFVSHRKLSKRKCTMMYFKLR